MSLPTSAIQTAVISLLKGDSTLTTDLGGASVYDMGGLPTNTPFPYIACYPITSQFGTAATMDLDGVDTWVQVSTYTQSGGGGFALARTISERVYALLNRQALTLSGSASNFFCLFENATELQEPDGLTQQVSLRFHLMTQG